MPKQTLQSMLKGTLLTEHVACRRGHDVLEVTPDKVDYMDVSPKKLYPSVQP